MFRLVLTYVESIKAFESKEVAGVQELQEYRR